MDDDSPVNTPRTAPAIRLSGPDLEGFVEPAAMIVAGANVVWANAAWRRDGVLSGPGPTAERLPDQIVQALAGLGGTGRARVKLDQPHGTNRVYDLVLLPIAGGDADGHALLLVHDHTMESGLRNALAESRARYKDMVEIASDSAWEVGRDGTFTFVAPQGLAGYAPRDLIGRRPEDLVDPDRHREPVIAFTAPAPLDRGVVWMLGPDLTPVCLEVSAVPLYDGEGVWHGARGCCRDVTEVRRRQSELAQMRARDRVLARIIRLFRRETEPENMIQAATSAITHGMGATGCQILGVGAPLARVITRPSFHVEGSFGRVMEDSPQRDALVGALSESDLDHPMRQTSAAHRVLAVQSGHGDRVNGAVLIFRDPNRPPFSPADEQLLATLAGQVGVALEQLYKHRALVEVSRSDGLTGLLNRRAFYEEMTRRIRRLARGEARAALMYVDLDNFKQVNDTRGHEIGDTVLVRVAEILRGNTRSTDMVARLGGDEFAVWLDDADAKVAARRAEVFLAAAAVLRKFSASQQYPLMLSIGIAVYDGGYGEDVNQFVSRADAAMYAIKRRGKGSYGIAPPPNAVPVPPQRSPR